MKKINFGIVGLGDIAESFALSFNQSEATLYGCASRTPEKSRAFAEKLAIPHAYDSYDELLQDPNIDAVYVSVPNLQHFSYCQKALVAGKHVLCEKAITVNLTELAALIALAEEKQLVLQEAMTIFNMPLYDKLAKLIANGDFGRLKMIQAPFGSFKEPIASNRFFNPDLGGGALLDIGTYAVSFLRKFMTNQPKIIATTMEPFSTGVDEQSVTIFQNGPEMGTVNLTFQAKMPKVGIVSFEQAYIQIPDYPRADHCEIFYNDGTTEIIEVGASSEALNYEVTNFLKVIAGASNASLDLTQDVIALLDEMQQRWHQ
ncbi:Gfo/Idh/MocA family protein [Enterococcus timonensis]|uniref:Gfo/Idh/MocA family protein n=1 Tax=Enterococcus timonensis TaxID=1852364 RepID=UPI0008DA3D54|nr:Gfo/Idh/MocA family oxidoreductase [Enterococcus timonensis]